MSGSPFIPRAYQGESEPAVAPMQQPKKQDNVGQTILKVQQYAVAALLLLHLLLPFLPLG